MGAGWFRRIIGHLVQHLRPVAARHSKTGRAGLFGKDEISGLQNLLPEYKTVILKYLEMGGNNKS